MLSAEAVGAPPDVAVPGAVAVELVHNFSLLHDDIIDGDQERRHRPTVWALFGIGAGLLVGDALHTLAFQVLLENPAAAATPIGQRLATSVAAMIDGQSSDMAFESQERVSVDDCRTMAEAKTGALLAFAASVGGRAGRRRRPHRRRPRRLRAPPRPGLPGRRRPPRHLGLAGGHRQAGRVRPHVEEEDAARRAGHGRRRHAADELAGLFRNGPLDEAAVVRATALIEAAGGRDATAELAREQLAAALAALEATPLDPTAAGELAALAQYVCDRQR